MTLLLAASKSIGTGFPGVGTMWACLVFGGGGAGRIREVPKGRGVGTAVQWVEVKASFAARFWSTVLAMLYHSSGFALEGLPLDMVATAFWIWGFRPLQNLTTIVFGSE